MRSSFVTRLGLLVAIIILVAFAVLAWITHRSTSDLFVEVQQEVLSIQPSGQKVELAKQIETIYDENKWTAVKQHFLQNVDELYAHPVLAVVVDQDLNIVTATNPCFLDAEVNRNNDGSFTIQNIENHNGQVSEFEMTVSGAIELADQTGTPFGTLVVGPMEVERGSGEQFALQVWQTAAVWLIATLAIAVAVTMFLLRRSLHPIKTLTEAARELQSGSIPDPIDHTGDAEFSQLFDAFNSATKTMAETNTIRQRFISDVAHELRTPLTNIKAQIEAAESGLIPNKNELLSTLQTEVRLLERLVGDFQELAVSDVGQLRIYPQHLPLNETIENILIPLAEHASAKVKLDIESDIHIWADEERLRQIFGNLVDNSARHKPDALILKIEAKPKGSLVEIDYVDNGPGVAKEDQPFIFDRLYRAEKSRNRSTGGSGLGLSIVKALLEAMGGSIKYVDDDTRGAKFRIHLKTEVTKDDSTRV